MNNRELIQEFNGKEWKIKAFSYRAAFMFEEMFGKNMSDIKTIRDNVEWTYCLFLAQNKDFNYTFEEFIDHMDNEPLIMHEIRLKVESEKK